MRSSGFPETNEQESRKDYERCTESNKGGEVARVVPLRRCIVALVEFSLRRALCRGVVMKLVSLVFAIALLVDIGASLFVADGIWKRDAPSNLRDQPDFTRRASLSPNSVAGLIDDANDAPLKFALSIPVALGCPTVDFLRKQIRVLAFSIRKDDAVCCGRHLG